MADPKERPILFSGAMVRAILAGQKTVTRRVVRRVDPARCTCNEIHRAHCPYGVPGDRLWVRETFASADMMYQGHENDIPSVVAYRADESAIQWDSDRPRPIPDWDRAQWNWDALKWKPSIHMPRWASRITLDVVDVRAERLHAIDDEDVVREGVTVYPHNKGCVPGLSAARSQFCELWDEINGKRAPWAANPWVWRVEFRRTP